MLYRQSLRKTFHMAWPIALARLIYTLSTFYAMVLLAHFGHEALAAGALIFAVQIAVSVGFFSSLFIVGPMVGRQLAEKKPFEAGSVWQQGIFLSVLISIPMILIFCFSKPILILCGQSPQLASIVQTFLRGFAICTTPRMMQVALQQGLVGVRRQHLVLKSSVLNMLVLLPLAYGLGFGKLGLPDWGVFGLGFALGFTGLVGFVFLVWVIVRDPFFKAFALFKLRLFSSWHYFKSIIKIGFPTTMQMSGELFFMLVMMLATGWLGVTALAASQVTAQWAFLLIVPMFGLCQAAGVLVSHAVGERDFDEVRRINQAAVTLMGIIGALVLILFLVAPRWLSSFYVHGHTAAAEQIIQLAVILFAIRGVSFLFDGFRNILISSLRGFYDTAFPMWVSYVFMWLIGLPLGCILAFWVHMGVIGIALGYFVAVTGGAFTMLWRWRVKLVTIRSNLGSAG